MTGPRHLRGEAEPAHVLDTPLGRHQPAELTGHPLGNLAPGPAALIRRWLGENRPQPLLLGRVEQRGSARIVVPAVAQPLDPMIVVAPHDLADPGRRIARDRCHHLGRVPLAQQPDDLKMTALDAVHGGLVAALEVVTAEVGCQINPACHPANLGSEAMPRHPSRDTLTHDTENALHLIAHAESV